MPKLRAPTRPTTATLKRLFALSGNRCAFPRCKTPLVEGEVLVGEVCHIKGRKRGAARYDAKQSSSARHGFGNLFLLCPNHHTIIDKPSECYTVVALRKMKAAHERRASALPDDLTDAATRLLRKKKAWPINEREGIIAETVNITVQHSTAGAIADRFGALKKRVLYLALMNDLPVELYALRQCLLESDLLQRAPFRQFFERWLTRTPAVLGWRALNALTREEFEALKQELLPLEV